jgi:hypothetical protein
VNQGDSHEQHRSFGLHTGGDRREKRQFRGVREALRTVIAVAISRRVPERTSQRGSPNGDCRVDDDVRGDGYARAHRVVRGISCQVFW